MPRGVGPAAVVATLALVAAVVLAASEPDRPVAVVGHTGALDAVSPMTAAPAPAPTPTPTTTTRAPVAATRSTTVVRTDSGTVTVVNAGSESANTGNNTVIGPGSATVDNGPATAVGNNSEVRVSRP